MKIIFCEEQCSILFNCFVLRYYYDGACTVCMGERDLENGMHQDGGGEGRGDYILKPSIQPRISGDILEFI
jgi:hypothetical protein